MWASLSASSLCRSALPESPSSDGETERNYTDNLVRGTAETNGWLLRIGPWCKEISLPDKQVVMTRGDIGVCIDMLCVLVVQRVDACGSPIRRHGTLTVCGRWPQGGTAHDRLP